MENFNEKYGFYLDYFNSELNIFFEDYFKNAKSGIAEAVKYSVLNGGKRVRPVLLLAAAETLGVKKERVIKYALALEFIHSYSLVHDDLPAMDNDDFRRGKFSTHKKFGEAMGILAGDALLNLAAETVLSIDGFDKKDAECSKLLFDYSGINGMILGQVYDMEGENSGDVSEDYLFKISENKTAKLITAPLLIASVISDKYYGEFLEYGKRLGVLFQITDDIFDETAEFKEIGKTPHKDKDKITAIKVFGLKKSRKVAEKLYKECKDIIKKIPNGGFLSDFTDYIYLRKN